MSESKELGVAVAVGTSSVKSIVGKGVSGQAIPKIELNDKDDIREGVEEGNRGFSELLNFLVGGRLENKGIGLGTLSVKFVLGKGKGVGVGGQLILKIELKDKEGP